MKKIFVGQKVKIVGRHDIRQKPNAVQMNGVVQKITPKRIYVTEYYGSVFVFVKDTLKEFGGNWNLRTK